MKLKAELFKAKDMIDHTESYFIIYSVEGEDIAFNCMSCEDADASEMVCHAKSGDVILLADNKNAPRRADMFEPDLLETFWIDG